MPEYKNPGKVNFDAIILSSGDNGGMYVEFPFDTGAKFGVTGRVPIKAEIDGIAYRGSLVKMGSTCHIVPVLKQIRESLNKTAGDKIHVVVELDEEERKIELAADALAALRKAPESQAMWTKLSFTHQREFHQWIESAKRAETRSRRIEQMVEKLAAGEKLS
jgi:hypothetical protein